MSVRSFCAVLFVFYVLCGVILWANPQWDALQWKLTMEQALKEVGSGGFIELNDGTLILVYGPTGLGKGAFTCYWPNRDGRGGVETVACMSDGLASIIKRVTRPGGSEYESDLFRFVKQMLPPGS